MQSGHKLNQQRGEEVKGQGHGQALLGELLQLQSKLQHRWIVSRIDGTIARWIDCRWEDNGLLFGSLYLFIFPLKQRNL